MTALSISFAPSIDARLASASPGEEPTRDDEPSRDEETSRDACFSLDSCADFRIIFANLPSLYDERSDDGVVVVIGASSASRSPGAAAHHLYLDRGSSSSPEPAAANSAAPSSASVERRLGAAFLCLRRERLYRALGFVRLSDYVTERVGLSYRTAQELMRVEASLARLPAIAAAFEGGVLTSSHVRILARVAAPDTETFWLALARRSSVRELAAAAAAARSNGMVDEATHAERSGAGSGAAQEAQVAPLQRLELEAPARLATLWRDTVALVRRLLGTEATAGECLEVVLAEFGAGAGVEWSAGPGELAGGERAIEKDDRDLHGSARAFDTDAVATASGAAAIPAGDARALDRELRELVCERPRHEAALAAHLRAVGSERRYRRDRVASLEEYALERFGLSPRRLYYLLALGRTLDRLPCLRAAFLSGRVTLRQALLVGSVATVRTEALWVERAAGVTLRRLEDEVDFWRHLKEARPGVWGLLEGGPIPEGIALVPGAAPRLHASAPREAVAFVRALGEDAASEPWPVWMVRIRMRAAPEVIGMWRDVIAWGRERYGGALREWEILALCLRDVWKTWDNVETRRQRRENPTLERDGWRCTAPGCRSVGTGRLQEHHVVFRSDGGGDAPSNRTTLCVGHHLGLLHEGKIRCSGRAPDELRWEMGVERGREAFLVYHGDRRSLT